MPNFEDDSGNCHAPDPNGLACYKSRIGCPIHPRQKRKCHGGAKGQAMTDEKIAEIRDLHKYLDEYPNTDVSSGDLHHYLSFLLAEVERLRDQIYESIPKWQANELQREINQLRDAMQFYADPNRYKSTSVHMCGHSTGQSVMIDGGRKAREALGVKS